MAQRFPSFKQIVRHDLPASVVIFLLGLPLAMGIAGTIGAPITAGLIAAIVGGIVGGLFGQVPIQLTGPAVSILLVASPVAHQYGFVPLLWLTLLAGCLQLLMGWSGTAKLAQWVPKSVLQGMLGGIGVCIAVNQGYGMAGIKATGTMVQQIIAIPTVLLHAHWPTLLIGCVSLVTIMLWDKFPPIKLLPAALAGIVVASLMAQLVDEPITRITMPQVLWDNSAWRHGIPNLPWHVWLTIPASLAFVGALYTTISAASLQPDIMQNSQALNREMGAQGTANILSSLLGGLPVTGVMPRSLANSKAGAISGASSLLHSLWLTLALIWGGPLLAHIPTSALAAVFVIIGSQLIQPKQWRAAIAQGDGLTYGATFVGVIAFSLIGGALLGILIWYLQQYLSKRGKHTSNLYGASPSPVSITVSKRH